MNESKDQERIAHLEERLRELEQRDRKSRLDQEAATMLGPLNVSVSRLRDPSRILADTARRLRRLLPLGAVAFYLVEEDTQDFTCAWANPPKSRSIVEDAVNYFIDNGFFAWAIRESSPLFLDTPDKRRFMLHSLSTPTRTRGMVAAELTQAPTELLETTFSLVSNLLLHTANALESFELYRWIGRIRREVLDRAEELAVSEETLGDDRFDLQASTIAALESTVRQYKGTLKERESLVKEVHHRVKNNLQIITSLLNLQITSSDNAEAVNMLRECRNRILSMSLVHEELYRSKDFSRVDFQGYAERLGRALVRSMAKGVRVSLHCDFDPPDMPIDLAVPCGLILNELITNCLKHAFGGREEGSIRLTGKTEQDTCSLTVEDDGPGLPEGLDLKVPDTLGLQLVAGLAEQLGGIIRRGPQGKGASVQVRFPGESPRFRPEG